MIKISTTKHTSINSQFKVNLLNYIKSFHILYLILSYIKIIIKRANFIYRNFIYLNFYNFRIDEHLTSQRNLVYLEKKFLGLQTNIKRKFVSPLDPRTKKKIQEGGMIGGDKMFWHGYNKIYSKYLSRIKAPKNICEIGILNGSGIATFSVIFPNSRIFGFDIDTSYFNKNYKKLVSLGAFKKKPNIYKYDQFKKNTILLTKIFKKKKIKLDLVVDDGFHSNETILNSFNELEPYLSKSFIYFIEDNPTVYDVLKKRYRQYSINKYGMMCVITNK